MNFYADYLLKFFFNKESKSPLKSDDFRGRGPSGRIRTCGILLPKQARYQLRYTRVNFLVAEINYTRNKSKSP